MDEIKNKKKEAISSSMTIERLKKFKGLVGLTDEEAKKVIYELETLASIAYKAFHIKVQEKNSNETKAA